MWWSVQGGTVASVPSEEGLGWVPPQVLAQNMGQAGQSAGFSKPVMEAMEDVSTVLKVSFRTPWKRNCMSFMGALGSLQDVREGGGLRILCENLNL